jgi:signal transduction histidine kinase
VGDQDRLAQVIRNLTTNALRYSDGPVSVAVGASDDVATIAVVDHGPGIPDADKTVVFTRFYRGDATGRSSSRAPPAPPCNRSNTTPPMISTAHALQRLAS